MSRMHLRLGFIALNDAAPLIVAKEKGFFAAEDLDVTLSREASWANVRDRVAAGVIDGGHMLGPMPIAATLGLSGEKTPLIAPLALNLNGSSIVVSTAVAEALREIDPQGMAERPRTARPVRRLIEARKARGEPPLTFAVVFPYSVHNYQLRYWLAAAGVDPDRDIRIVVVPPPRMAERLEAGDMDGFCVTAPWPGVAVEQGLGEIMIYASEWWGAGPDKVFALREDWAEKHPEALRATLRALLRAAAWADAPEHRPEVARLLAREDYVGAPESIVRISLVGSPPYARGEAPGASLDYLVYHRYAASFPWRSHALWFASQMVRWGQAGPDLDFTAAARVYRPDLFRAAAGEVGQPAPLIDAKPEGAHTDPWMLNEATAPIAMAPDAFFDGGFFDPTEPLAYALGFGIRKRVEPVE